jgi:hypothetical protein
MKIVKISLSLILSLVTVKAFAGAIPQEETIMSSPKRCASPHLGKLERLLVENELDVLRARRGFKSLDLRTAAPIVVPIYFHVINKGPAVTDGNVGDAVLKEQVDVMNKAYAPVQVSFTLAGIDRTTDAKWMGSSMWTAGETAMKNALRKGDSGALNVYTTAATDGTLGWATFPWDYNSKPKMDGVVIHYGTLPGGTYPAYDLGMTLVHEAGHWLGLFHTFQGGCSTGGDSIADTPPEKSPNFGCPSVAPDSCPGDKDADPIHNFMDYTDDVCLTDFSSGQIQRVHDSFDTYRGI